jgi:hypothetical protein
MFYSLVKLIYFGLLGALSSYFSTQGGSLPISLLSKMKPVDLILFTNMCGCPKSVDSHD